MTGPGALLGAGGMARYVVTDRDGVRSTPSRSVRLDPNAARLGASGPPYARFDLASHVGDDPSTTSHNRGDLVRALAPSGVTAVQWMHQVHGNDVVVVGSANDAISRSGPWPSADALVATGPGVALMVLVADCVPVVLADDAAGVVAAAHAGRKGVQLGVVATVVAAMAAAGAEPARVHAVVGPAVCPACYEVPAEMRDEVASVVPAAAATSRAGTPALHLRRAVAAQLSSVGVTSIDVVGACTVEDTSLYSYRRDGRTGRFAMLAWLADV